MRQYYEVRANDVPAMYQSNYFPRRFRYKKDAIQCAKAVIEAGASMARVEFPDGAELDFRPEKPR